MERQLLLFFEEARRTNAARHASAGNLSVTLSVLQALRRGLVR